VEGERKGRQHQGGPKALALFPLPPIIFLSSKAHSTARLPPVLHLPYSTRSPTPLAFSNSASAQTRSSVSVRPCTVPSLAPSPTPGRAFKSAAAPSAERLSRCPGPCIARGGAALVASVPSAVFLGAHLLPLLFCSASLGVSLWSGAAVNCFRALICRAELRVWCVREEPVLTLWKPAFDRGVARFLSFTAGDFLCWGCWQELSCICARGFVPESCGFLLRPLLFFIFSPQRDLSIFS
jgi:hypothetical protein